MIKAQMLQLIKVIDEENWDALDTLFTPDLTYEVPGREPIKGMEALQRYYRVERALSEGRHDIEGVLADGEYAVSWGRFRARAAAGQADIDVRFACLCQFPAGLLGSRRRACFDLPS